MMPHPRIRKAIKWVGAAVTVLLAVVWIGSATTSVSYLGANGRGVIVGRGEVSIHVERTLQVPPQFIGWRRDVLSPGTGVWADAARTRLIWPIRVPMWPAVCACFLGVAIAWRLDHVSRRRERVGRCPKCSYDRTGLAVGAACPECGSACALASSARNHLPTSRRGTRL
jgi:hypothetical protein